MPLPSYRVLSHVYIRPPSSVSVQAKEIAPEEHKSMQGEAPTVGSYGHATNTITFKGGEAVTVTSNNRFPTPMGDYLRNGPVRQIDDYYFGHWVNGANENYPSREWNNLIPKMPDFGLITSPRLGMYLPSEHDTPVGLRTSHDIVNAVNPNRLGYFQSKLANFEQDLRNLMFDSRSRLNYEASEWVDFLSKKGFSIDTTPSPGVMGLGVMKGDFVAAHFPGRGYLVGEENFQDKARHIISRYGLTDKEAVEAMKRSVLLHEFGHVLGIKGDRESEKLQGELQAEFYSMMAERFKGTSMEGVYRALAEEGREYAKNFSTRKIWKNITKVYQTERGRLDDIIEKFEVEAKALGLEGKELIAYVNSRLRNTAGAILEGEPTYRSSKHKASNSKKLEEIVDEKEEAEAKSDPRYQSKIDKSEYKNMRDVKEREVKSEKAEKEAPQESEAPA